MTDELAQLREQVEKLTREPTDDEVERVAQALTARYEEDRTFYRFRELLFSQRRKLIRAALTVFLRARASSPHPGDE